MRIKQDSVPHDLIGFLPQVSAQVVVSGGAMLSGAKSGVVSGSFILHPLQLAEFDVTEVGLDMGPGPQFEPTVHRPLIVISNLI